MQVICIRDRASLLLPPSIPPTFPGYNQDSKYPPHPTGTSQCPCCMEISQCHVLQDVLTRFGAAGQNVVEIISGGWEAALVAPAGVWALLHPAALWPSKGKLRVSQLQGKLSFATECEIQTKHCYLRIYPFPSTRHSCGSAFTSLALVADSSQKHEPPLSVVLLPTALSYTRRLTEPQVPFCALQWGLPSLRAQAGVLLCRGPH